MDDYQALFFGSPQTSDRLRLFENYLKNSVEGRARASAGTQTATTQQMWDALTVEEQTTFLAVTAALGVVHDQSGSSLLEWIDSLEEINGDAPYLKGP
jgi:hypothetical protein